MRARAIMALATVAIALGVSDASALVWPDVPERILRELSSADPTVRRAAAREVGSLGPTRGRAIVMSAMADPDVDVRIAIAQAAIRLHVGDAAEASIPWLGEHDPALRVAACAIAREMPSARAVPHLARTLGDSDSAVRTAAAEALGAQASADAVAPLLGHLDDPHPGVRIAVAKALARLGDSRAVVPLVGKVQDSVADVREAIARALGDLGDPRAAQALLLQLRDNVEAVRVGALASLARLRAPDTAASIASLVTDRNGPTRQAAIAALGQIATPTAVRALIATLGQGDDAGGGLDRTPVRDALVAAGPNATGELAAIVTRPPNANAATSAAWVLGETQAHAHADEIIAALRRGALPPAAALHALAGAGTNAAVPVVLEFVADANPLVRDEAIRAADALLDPTAPDGRAVEPLATALRDARMSAAERADLATLLGRTGAPRAAEVLTSLAAVKDRTLRIAAIDALGTLGPANADDALLEPMSDPDPTVRLHAAMALANAGGAKARDALLAKIDGDDEIDRAALLTALAGILSRVPDDAASARLVRLLDLAAGPERDAILEAIGRTKTTSSTRALAALAKSGDADDRRTIASLLGALADDPKAHVDPAVAREAATLADSLAHDPDPATRAQAAWSLGALADATSNTSLRTLREIVRGADLDAAIDATAALGRVFARASSPRDAASSLCPLLADPRAYVRANALAGLALAKARCQDGAPERQALLDDDEAVRAAAALAIVRSPLGDADRRALDRCTVDEHVVRVAARCRAAHAVPEGTHPVDVYVVRNASDPPRVGAPYVIEFANGIVRAGTTDRRGALFEPLAPTGDVALRRPALTKF